MIDQSLFDNASIIWGYHHMHHQLKKADLIFVLGSHDIRVAEHAARTYLDGYAPTILFSGNAGVGKSVSGFGGTPEAVRFAERAQELGVSKRAILIEDKATNTGENIKFAQQMLKDEGLVPKSIIAVQKPYMERRTYATLVAQWDDPKPEFIISSQDISFEEYIQDPRYPTDYTINVMVGDLQRIKEYPSKGFQIKQDVPKSVWQAWKELVAAGYNKHLIKE